MTDGSAPHSGVDEALAEIYEGEQPRVFPTDAAGVDVVGFWREDPNPHWHLITRGLSGPQLTVRIASTDQTDPPSWVIGALTQLSRYADNVGVPSPGQVLNLGPLFAGFSAHLRALWFVKDPELTLDATDFVQVVGITPDELEAISNGESEAIGYLLLSRSPVYLTEPDRESVITQA